MRSRLRPNRSLSPPAKSAPTRQPTRAQLFAQPRTASLVEPEERLEERLGPADDDPVVAEEQPAHGRHGRDEPDVAEVEPGGRVSEARTSMTRGY